MSRTEILYMLNRPVSLERNCLYSIRKSEIPMVLHFALLKKVLKLSSLQVFPLYFNGLKIRNHLWLSDTAIDNTHKKWQFSVIDHYDNFFSFLSCLFPYVPLHSTTYILFFGMDALLSECHRTGNNLLHLPPYL